jgi:regulation of enolase protein 1 (concanavalin A-like superfamily)
VAKVTLQNMRIWRWTLNFSDFKWLNKSSVEINKNTVTIFAPGGTDYFNSPVPDNGVLVAPQGNAPLFYQEVKGDFVFGAKLKPSHVALFDAASLMVFQSQLVWVKAGYEMTDYGIRRLLSVVTNQLSDDANGCILVDVSEVWLQIARKGNNLAIHYSLDGEKYDMLRVCALPLNDTVKVGLEAQCGTGNGSSQTFIDVSLNKKTIDNIWVGK